MRIFIHNGLEGRRTHNAVLRQLILSLIHLDCCGCHLAVVIRRLIVVHKAELHETRLQIFDNPVSRTDADNFRRRLCGRHREIHVRKLRAAR